MAEWSKRMSSVREITGSIPGRVSGTLPYRPDQCENYTTKPDARDSRFTAGFSDSNLCNRVGFSDYKQAPIRGEWWPLRNNNAIELILIDI